MPTVGRSACFLLLCLLAASAQDSDPPSLVTTGNITIAGQQVSYRIRHLPVSSFPDLPMTFAAQLTQRGCLIPQTYQAHQPENVIHGSFQAPGSSDWAVLCSTQGTVSLLVFFAGAPESPTTLASTPETQRLQTYPGDSILGFNWGIDPASPRTVRQAQTGLQPRPLRLDHDAIADSVIDRKTVYRYFAKGSWSVVDLPD